MHGQPHSQVLPLAPFCLYMRDFMGTRLVKLMVLVTRLHNDHVHCQACIILLYRYVLALHMSYMIHLGLIIVIRLFVRFTFQSLVSPGRISGLSKPSTVTVLREKLTKPSLRLEVDTTYPEQLHPPAPSSLLPSGLRQQSKQVSHKKSLHSVVLWRSQQPCGSGVCLIAQPWHVSVGLLQPQSLTLRKYRPSVDEIT